MIAYFSMEVALAAEMPTYAGGLGVLAGDTLRSAADLGIPMAGVTLLHRHGYFRQRLDTRGHQREEPAPGSVEQFVVDLPSRATVRIEGRPVQVRSWKFEIAGAGTTVPVYLLDTDLAKTRRTTAPSPTHSTAATRVIACVRKWSSESAASGSCALWGIRAVASIAIT